VQILLIGGIFEYKFRKHRWNDWVKELSTEFPEAEVVPVFKGYVYTEHKKTKKLVQDVVTCLENGRPTIVIGHSYGGIIAKAAIAQAQHADILLLVTMGTPHTLKLPALTRAREAIQAPTSVAVPALTYGGYDDIVVLPKYTKMSGAKHKNITSTHWFFHSRDDIRERILADIKQELKERNSK